MLKIENKKAQSTAKAGQAAIELAVFGAILVFILGTIVRSAVGNGYEQNQNFKAMRMAMLASWNSSKATNMSRTSASILFVEDRLSPDLSKYGDLDRIPFIAQGSGTFSYQVLYPLDASDVASNLPIMDVYINGQHFPFTTASYVTNRTITRPACPSGGPYPLGNGLTQAQCLQNQCLRNQREWVLPTVDASQFDTVVPVSTLNTTTIKANGNAIFNELVNEGLITLTSGFTSKGTVNSSTLPSQFVNWFGTKFPGAGQASLNQIQSILQSNLIPYKLFYTRAVNGAQTAPFFSPTPPTTCSGTNNALCSSLTVLDSSGNPYTNTNGDMQYDLQRTGNYATVDAQFPPVTSCSAATAANMRCYMAWQWAASAATTAASIGLDPGNNQYPQGDIDGRLAPPGVTIYAISQNSNGTPTVSYEDPQGGDIDGSWGLASCGPKPGLQSDSQIFTFTQNGTYLQIKEGKLYNPETDQFVRSVNKRDTIDLVQRIIQLSNNTGDFCNGATPQSGVINGSPDPNPVEVCIPPGSSDNCFSSQQNIKSTCFDENDNMLFVRSRLEDRRGHFWMTDTSGQLQVQ